VASGTVCIDKYEASVWHVPPHQKGLIEQIQKGTVQLANLIAGGATQLGLASGDLAASGCPAQGNGCVEVFAVSIPGVQPARYINWFQAAAAARNSLKRLPTNQEWQVAALGTPDGPPCVVSTASPPPVGPADTGSAAGCVSDVGAFDMVGNVSEWVADWGDQANSCVQASGFWPATFANDTSCVGGPGLSFSNLPGAFLRGGFFGVGVTAKAGVFAVVVAFDPTLAAPSIGFRAAR
jgi:formylglycine-generating enzyme required for sulfatase activity